MIDDQRMVFDNRKAAILSAVVQQYIETAQPVGSSRVSNAPGVAVSPATVRHEMAVLEEQGYLAQPHTSAGRIPTDKGYRFFVDALRKRDPSLVAADRGMVRQFFADAHGELESVLARTSDLLISLTDCAAVVVGPNIDVARVRSTQMVDLASHVVMVVAVMSNGVIEKRTVEVATELTPQIVQDANRRLADTVVGRSLAEIQPQALDDDPLLNAAVEALRAASHTAEIVVGGASRVAAAFDAVDQIREVLAILEQQIVVVSLIRDVLDRGMRVAIGQETGVEPLADCSLVVAPYSVEGETTGMIGVLGPTRMDYEQALSAVAVVSRRLGRVLSEN
ncbi:MAG: heat-inducible transcriptional repressor HrcA [Acidimicrobiaceae bacterium]|nr:heat-inducible transcriptional repressor HrcA [Acidimicrobiaceae bacterium]MDE0606577.1 heat-inducible transcriptional repressor HrcA [Acidimicrobiaceae bacterium]